MFGIQLSYFFQGVRHYKNGFVEDNLFFRNFRTVAQDVRSLRKEIGRNDQNGQAETSQITDSGRR